MSSHSGARMAQNLVKMAPFEPAIFLSRKAPSQNDPNGGSKMKKNESFSEILMPILVFYRDLKLWLIKPQICQLNPIKP